MASGSFGRRECAMDRLKFCLFSPVVEKERAVIPMERRNEDEVLVVMIMAWKRANDLFFCMFFLFIVWFLKQDGCKGEWEVKGYFFLSCSCNLRID
jgi:hypothetical protein